MKVSKKALITGITGMDGSYLAELLLSKGYKVYGLVRRTSTSNRWRIEHLLDKITILDGCLLDQSSIMVALEISEPDEVYALAADSFVGSSWSHPLAMAETTGLGMLRTIDAIRLINPKIKTYAAMTSELFGSSPPPQSEATPFSPRSPYGVAKLFGFYICKNYRESYGMFIANGILFNHSSPRRGIEFVERKITDGVARIVHKKQEKLYLGNLDSKRDFGSSLDYMRAAWLMLQRNKPRDFVIGSGTAHTIREVCEVAFGEVGLNYQDYVEIDPKFFRPAEVNCLLADASLAKRELGWEPQYTFEGIVREMLAADLKRQSGA